MDSIIVSHYIYAAVQLIVAFITRQPGVAMITVLIANIAHFSRSAESAHGSGVRTAKAREPGHEESVVGRSTMTIAGVAMVLIALMLGLLPI